MNASGVCNLDNIMKTILHLMELKARFKRLIVKQIENAK